MIIADINSLREGRYEDFIPENSTQSAIADDLGGVSDAVASVGWVLPPKSSPYTATSMRAILDVV
jgi:hypothetical protein